METRLPLKISSPQTDTGARDEVIIQAVPAADDLPPNYPVQIELMLSQRLAPAGLIAAADEAQDYGNLRFLDTTIITLEGSGNWTAWARPVGEDPDIIVVWLRNDMNPEREFVQSHGSLNDEVPLTVKLQLSPQTELDFADIALRFDVSYFRAASHSFRCAYQQQLTVPLLKDQAVPPQLPRVSLYTPVEAPTALSAGTEVEIHWQVENGISGKLTGPLLGGNQVLTLTPDSEPNLAHGKIKVNVFGIQVYKLTVLVSRESDRPNRRVERLLILDVRTSGKYGLLNVTPTRVLPNADIQLHWAAWGVQRAVLNWPGGSHEALFQPPDRDAASPKVDLEGSGILTVGFRKVDYSGNARLTLYQSGQEPLPIVRSFDVIRWAPLVEGLKEEKPGRDLAYARRTGRGFVALRMRRRLLFYEVGVRDSDYVRGELIEDAHPIRALAADDGWFVGLRPAGGGQFGLSRFFPDEAEVFLSRAPDPLAAYLEKDEPVRMRILNGRCYITTYRKHATPDGIVRIGPAWSFDLDDTGGAWTFEPVLAGLAGFRLAICDKALYCLNRATGDLFRLDPETSPASGGTLSLPKVCAPARNQKGESLVKTGAPTPIGRLLVVLGTRRKDIDMVYNPMADAWSECGGPITDMRVAAYRGGRSPRVWGLFSDQLAGLAVGDPDLFDSTYIRDNPTLSVPEVAFAETSQITVTNQTGSTLSPPDADLIKAGCHAVDLPEGVGYSALKTVEPDETYTLTLFHRKGQSISGALNWVMEKYGLVVTLHFRQQENKWHYEYTLADIRRDRPQLILHQLPHMSRALEESQPTLTADFRCVSIVIINNFAYDMRSGSKIFGDHRVKSGGFIQFVLIGDSNTKERFYFEFQEHDGYFEQLVEGYLKFRQPEEGQPDYSGFYPTMTINPRPTHEWLDPGSTRCTELEKKYGFKAPKGCRTHFIWNGYQGKP